MVTTYNIRLTNFIFAAAIASAVGVAMQLGITAAMDAKNGGYAATSEMQSGHMDSTTKQYQALVGNSLLFGGNINTNVNNTSGVSIDEATNISSNNMNQTGSNNESALFESKHETIDPNWSGLMTEAAINGVVSGVTVAAGPLISAGIGKVASFAATGIEKVGLTAAVESVSSVASKMGSVVDDIMQTTGLKALSNSIDDVTASVSKSVDDLLGTGVKSSSKASGVLVSGADDLGKVGNKVDDVVNAGNKADDAIKSSDNMAKVNKATDNIVATNKVDDVASNANKLDDTANNVSKADDVAKKPQQEVKSSEYGTTAREKELKAASKDKMALADNINNEVKNLDLNDLDDMQVFQKQRDSWVQKIEGYNKTVYNDTAKIPQKTVDHGFNMDSPGADKLWNKAFENYSGPKPDFNKVIKGIDNIDEFQIDHLYKHVVQSKEDQLIKTLNKGAPDTWSKLKPNERLALESANYNSPSLIGKNLTKHIQNYTKSGSADDLAKAVKELQSNGGKGYPSFNRDLQPRRDGEAKLLAG